MRLGALHVCFDAGDLCFQRFDARLKLLDRHGVEVLFCKLHQRVAGLAGEQVFQVHERIVDRVGGQVNKRRAVSSIPHSMLAAVAPQPDGAEELALVERRVPRPGPGEVLIEVAAAGVNRPDILQRRGLYPPPPGAPDILGLEISGRVVEVGEGAEALMDQLVCALVAGGGYAEYCVAPAGTCLMVPSALSLVMMSSALPEECSPWPSQPPYDVIWGKAWHTDR